jgi:hypothetical protein
MHFAATQTWRMRLYTRWTDIVWPRYVRSDVAGEGVIQGPAPRAIIA